MQYNIKLNKAKKVKDDEYYTIYRQFELWVQKFLLDKLVDKKIYCPCDSDWSNIVKVLKDYKDILKYKELIYTSDDFRIHDKEFSECDIVITNPPFSLAIEFYQMLKKHKCQYFYYGIIVFLNTVEFSEDLINTENNIKYLSNCEIGNEKYEPARGKVKCPGAENAIGIQSLFLHKDGTYRKVNYYIYTNIPGIQMQGSKDVKLTKKLSDVEEKFGYVDDFKNCKVLNINNWRDYPIDYQGIAAISPLSYNQWYDKFDVLLINNTRYQQNGKKLFARWLVKLKGSPACLDDIEELRKPKSIELF